MHEPWRLIESPPAAGDWNMAVDELLLEEAAAGGRPTLRLYSWHRPTLSLGYFQQFDDVPPEDRQRYPIVRRLTGGGAILHDREVTYALAVPATMMNGPELYARVNRAILAALRQFGVEGRERGRQRSAEATQEGESFLCFARQSATDIIACSRKLAGSAQRRRRGGLLQQGSVLLESEAPWAVGLRDLAGISVDYVRLAAALVRGFAGEFAAAIEPGNLTADEQTRAEELRQRRYADIAWLRFGGRKGEP